MKKKNGFTLIELLAILVILAIIAVITIPKINKVINESKQNAARNSAYGYKDAIEKWQTSQFEVEDIYLDGNYTISNGKLDNYTIPITGSAPSSGYLTYEDDDLINGCLVINGYEAIYQNGKFTSSGKGDCVGSNLAISCNDDEYLYEEYNYTITNQNACETYFNDEWGCENDTSCIEEASDYCTSESESTILKDVNDGHVNYSNVESFLSRNVKDSWCRPKSEECFKLSDNGDGTATLDKYLCGAEWDGETESYITQGKILDVNIPSQLTGKNGKLTVTTIGYYSFLDNQLTSVTIPDSATIIDGYAFFNNQLTSVTIPDSVTTIGYGAFSYNQLNYVIIGHGVTSIGDTAFSKFYSDEWNNGNMSLSTIYNNTGRSFNWKKIVWATSSATFETGTINNSLGNVTVTTGYPSNNSGGK